MWRNLERYAFPGAVYPVNGSRDVVWGRRCFRSLKDLPEAPDHVVVIVPASHVAGVLEEAAAARARSATVFSSGFDEARHAAGRALGQTLRETIARTGLAVPAPIAWATSSRNPNS